MTTGVQFTGSLAANQTQRWFTFNWPAAWHDVVHDARRTKACRKSAGLSPFSGRMPIIALTG